MSSFFNVYNSLYKHKSTLVPLREIKECVHEPTCALVRTRKYSIQQRSKKIINLGKKRQNKVCRKFARISNKNSARYDVRFSWNRPAKVINV